MKTSVGEKSPSKRSRHSCRDLIRAAIRRRFAMGEKLSIRAILKETGGSAGTVSEEISLFTAEVAKGSAVLVGVETLSPFERTRVLERVVNEGLVREQSLRSQVASLEIALAEARSAQLLAEKNVSTMLATHQDAQHKLMQGVDDLRQMVQAGKDALPLEMLVAKASQAAAASRAEKGAAESIYWQTKHDQLLARYVEMENKNRKLRSQLHELGVDID